MAAFAWARCIWSGQTAPVPSAIVFDLDGVLVDSEPIWAGVRERYIRTHGGRYAAEAEHRMKGMSATEWAAFLHGELGVCGRPEVIATEVADEVAAVYRGHLPLLPGAVATVRALAARWPLGLASSANRTLIELVLGLAGLHDSFSVVVSSEEVSAGKPAPDVYLEAARRLHVDARMWLAVEDSTNGILSALAAGMSVVAVPRDGAPVPADVLARCAAVLGGVAQLSPSVVERLAPG
jgi:HAD superfamily hydrolase (TIGR01509 family)